MAALLNGGLQAVFGAAFGAVYLPGYLLRTTLADDGEGGYAVSHAVHSIKGQVDQASERMRRGDGYTDGDMRVIVLQSGVTVEPNTDDLTVLGGKVWVLSGIQADPAITHWEMTGRLGVMPKPTTSFTSPTNDSIPTINGTGLAGASIDIGYGASTVMGAATVASDGTWSAVLPELADGTYAIRARQTLGGVTSAWASGGDLVVDTLAPDAPIIVSPASPHVTTDTMPMASGTAEPDATITIYLDGESYGETLADGDGLWSFAFSALGAGETYEATATATDAAGNTSAPSAALVLVINHPLAIEGTPVTLGVMGEAYAGFTASVPANHGVPPFTFSLLNAAPGLSIDAVTGEVSGTLTQAGIFENIVVQVEDSE